MIVSDRSRPHHHAYKRYWIIVLETNLTASLQIIILVVIASVCGAAWLGYHLDLAAMNIMDLMLSTPSTVNFDDGSGGGGGTFFLLSLFMLEAVIVTQEVLFFLFSFINILFSPHHSDNGSRSCSKCRCHCHIHKPRAKPSINTHRRL